MATKVHPGQLELRSEQITSVYEPVERPELTPEQDRNVEQKVQQGVGSYGEVILHATGVNVFEEPEKIPYYFRKRYYPRKPTSARDKAAADMRPDLKPSP